MTPSFRALAILAAVLACASGGYWAGARAQGMVFFAPVMSQGPVSNGKMVKWVNTNLIADGGTLDQISFTQPSSGFNQTIPAGIRYYIIGNNALLASGTVNMPTDPTDGQRITISSRSAVTLFTVSPSPGQTLYGPLTSLVGGGNASWIYRASDASWYRIG